jgi:signal peptidase I
MFVFPATIREYTFMVGGQPVSVKVPVEWAQSEYGFDYVVERNLYPDKGEGALTSAIREAVSKSPNIERSTYLVQDGAHPLEARVYWIPLGRKVRQGEKFLSFDILTGDLLFVDRLSYNFIQPKVGSGFVFRTENIHSSEMLDANRNQMRQYYVKRLVGVPGDVLEIKAPVLYRNGQQIEGSDAFGKNARREGLYPGYTNTGVAVMAGGDQTVISDGLMPPGGKLTVPANVFFALGDNSPRSKDSRFWGFVPEKDVVGRPLFIYYPLTSRWGPAK